MYEWRNDSNELEKIEQFVSMLAKTGVKEGSVEESTLELEIATLFGIKQNPCEIAFNEFRMQECTSIVSEMIYGPEPYVVLCSSLSEKWNQLKSFCKRNKRTILIGATVVIATIAVVGIAMLVSAPASADSTLANFGGVTQGKKEEEGQFEQDSIEDPFPQEDFYTTGENIGIVELPPTESLDHQMSDFMNEIVDDHFSYFKDELGVELPNFEEIDDAASFSDNIREIGAHTTHIALDIASEYFVGPIPWIQDKIQKHVLSYLPKTGLFGALELSDSPQEDYESLMAKAHELIDHVF